MNYLWNDWSDGISYQIKTMYTLNLISLKTKLCLISKKYFILFCFYTKWHFNRIRKNTVYYPFFYGFLQGKKNIICL